MAYWLNKRWRVGGVLALGLYAAGAVAGAVPAAASSSSGAAAAPATAPATSALTLEQAVAKVQSETHGKVLRADSRQYGNAPEYRIKVLTPDGHVRVISVSSRPVRGPEDKPKETH